MKNHDTKILKSLNYLTSLAIKLFVVFFLSKLFAVGALRLGNSIKGFAMYDVIVKPVGNTAKADDRLDIWFGNRVVVQPTNRALVHLRIKTYEDLFSLP